ncbi:MAG TPA: methylisocitrate lyase [Trueperaceae bacterium]|nr:methylisocitrate lyase [Trueperaceae bacterium]
MLFSQRTAHAKRRDLRSGLASGRLLRLPGAFSPLVARLLGEQGWDGVYISGAVIAADLGLPDIGLTGLNEVVDRGRVIARASDLPALLDADTGFGEPVNVARTVQELEDAGLAALHLEDQENPKRCGHLDHKRLVDTATMVRRVRAAREARRDEALVIVARTDARAVEGLDGAIARARAYVEAGADAVFPEALESVDEFAAFRDALDVPLLANMTEFGKSPLLRASELERLGYNMVIYPVTSLRLAMGAVEEGLARLKREGTQEPLLGAMQTRARLYEVLDYRGYNAFDQGIFDFTLED